VKFKLDENLPDELGPLLRQSGHEAHSVRDEHLEGSTDLAIAQACRSERRVIITLDLDFADVRLYPPQESPRIIVLRLSRQDKNSVLAIIPRLLALLRSEPIAQRLWIVDESRTPIRGEA
jgi:predicted nuclease of predicted toxin-antitoxin system